MGMGINIMNSFMIIRSIFIMLMINDCDRNSKHNLIHVFFL